MLNSGNLKSAIYSINKKKALLGLAGFFFTMAILGEFRELYSNYKEQVRTDFIGKVKTTVKDVVTTNIHSDLPTTMRVDDEYFRVAYSFDTELESYIKKIVRRYRPDHASVVVIDNKSGAILSAVDFARDGNKFSRTLSFSATHPAASLFKVVTAADLIENHNMATDKRFSINGRGTTLYRYQLKDKVNRWTRYIPFTSAFAYSNNPVFGKAAIKESSARSLYQMGIDLGFNQDLMEDFSLGKSQLKFPKGDYELAEISSGFNRQTLISPVHAATLASVFANDGILKKPHLVTELKSQNFDISFDTPGKRVLSVESTEEISSLMERTVTRGTARGAYRRLNSKLKQSLDVGGKTGSLTGGVPFGKRDWLIMYAKPKIDQKYLQSGDGISLCVMMVNKKKWYVKSSYLARRIIEYYYRDKKLVN